MTNYLAMRRWRESKATRGPTRKPISLSPRVALPLAIGFAVLSFGAGLWALIIYLVVKL